MKKKSVVVLYHADCLDGFCAMWVAWKKFGNKAFYYAVSPRQLPSDMSHMKHADVYVLDNSLTRVQLDLLRKNDCVVTVLDHHASSETDVKSADVYVFDIKHSGAMLAWKYFFPHVKVPWLVRYVEDGDLWNFKLAHTDHIRNVLVLGGYHLRVWNSFARALENPTKKKSIIAEGKIIERYRKTLIEQSTQNAYLVRLAGYTVYAVNEATEAFRSEVAHILYAKKPPFSVAWAQEQDKIHVSLRSDGLFDVSKLAKKYGGGGHAAAAGFSISAEESFPWRIVKKTKKAV